jgi:glutaconyl-CoA decarboxylase
MRYQFVIGENRYDVQIESIRDGVALVTVNTKPYEVVIENYAEVMAGESAATHQVMPAPTARAPAGSLGVILAPIPGLIMDVLVKVGDRIAADQVVLTMEAMKMLNDITSRVAGVVREIRVQKGSEVSTGDVLVVIG